MKNKDIGKPVYTNTKNSIIALLCIIILLISLGILFQLQVKTRFLVNTFKLPDSPIKETLMKFITFYRETIFLDSLLHLAQSKDSKISSYAWFLLELYDYNPPLNFVRINAQYLGHPNLEVRKTAAEVISNYTDQKKDYSLILKLAKDPDNRKREAIIKEMLDMNDSALMNQLIESLSDTDPTIRAMVADRIYWYCTPQVLAALNKTLLHDPDARVRVEAIGSVKSLCRSRYFIQRGPPLTFNSEEERKKAIEPLYQALSDKNGQVRSAAVSALGVMDDQRAVEPIKDLIRRKDRAVYNEAIRALKYLEPESAVQYSVLLLQEGDPIIEKDISEALQGGSSHKLLPELRRAINKPDIDPQLKKVLRQLIKEIEDEARRVY